jgi:hypothetical protein
MRSRNAYLGIVPEAGLVYDEGKIVAVRTMQSKLVA